MPRSKKVLTDEERAAIRAKQNESLRPGRIGELPRAPDGKVLPRGKKVRKLSSQKHDDLVAIDHVLSQPPEADRTYQQSNFRKLQQDDLASLYRLKIQLEGRKPEPPAEPVEVPATPSLPPLIRDGETPCPLCGQAAYPEDETEARLLAETQLNAIPDKLAEWPKLKARIAELEAELKDNHCASCDGSAPECWKNKREEVPSGPA